MLCNDACLGGTTTVRDSDLKHLLQLSNSDERKYEVVEKYPRFSNHIIHPTSLYFLVKW